MRILVLPGDGIGPEIVNASLEVLRAASTAHQLQLAFDFDEVGFASLEKHGTTLREDLLDKAKTYDGLILGTISHADHPKPENGGRNVSAGFCVGLDLYANVRPARTRAFLESNMKPGRTMDLVIMREATEGFYADRNMYMGWGEMMPSKDMALSVRKITRHCSERIARRAFERAMKRRKKVTAIHKANSFHLTDGLFLEAVRSVAKEFAEVELDDLHGSAPSIAGRDIANPTSMILSTAMLLQWIGEKRGLPSYVQAGNAMEAAVDKVLADPGSRTADLDGKMGTQ